MATGGKEPPDAALNKFYRCHPQTKVGAVVCLLCENVYHTSEIVNKYNSGGPVKFISNTLIICHEHPSVALKSKLPYGALSKEVKELITQIKLTTKEQIKQEIINEITKEQEKGLNETIYENHTELETLRIQNELLTQLNEELRDKNKILNELLTKEKQGIMNNEITTKTYAEITTNPKPKNKRVPKLIIKKTNTQDNTDLEKTVLEHITKDKTVKTKSVVCKNKDTMIINCINEESINSLEEKLSMKLANNFKIEKEQINKPKLKIIDIDKTYGDIKEIECDINQRNFSNMEDKCKVLHVYLNTRTNRNSAIVEVTANIYKYIKDNKSRIFIGYQSCRAFDLVNTTPCSKCARFGHSSKKCKNQYTCHKCAASHPPEQCTSTKFNCPNCVYSNTTFKTKYNTSHSAIDSHTCEILKAKIKKYIEMTDYPTNPVLTRYFGKMETYPNHSTVTLQRKRLASVDSTGSQHTNYIRSPLIPLNNEQNGK